MLHAHIVDKAMTDEFCGTVKVVTMFLCDEQSFSKTVNKDKLLNDNQTSLGTRLQEMLI